MNIAFEKLLAEYRATTGKRLTKRDLAREIAKRGIYTERQAENIIQYHRSGKAESRDVALLYFLRDFFGKSSIEDILLGGTPSIAEVAKSIRDDAPGLTK